MMEFQSAVDSEPFFQYLGRLEHAMVYGTIPVLANRTLDEIQSKTLSGVDYRGKPFKKYSKEYKNRSGKQDPPDLWVTGDMLLNALRLVGAELLVPEGDPQRGKAEGNQRLREWIGVGRDVYPLLERDLLAMLEAVK